MKTKEIRIIKELDMTHVSIGPDGNMEIGGFVKDSTAINVEDNLHYDLVRSLLIRLYGSCSNDALVICHIEDVLRQVSEKYSMKYPLKVIKFGVFGIKPQVTIGLSEIYKEQLQTLVDFYNKEKNWSPRFNDIIINYQFQ